MDWLKEIRNNENLRETLIELKQHIQKDHFVEEHQELKEELIKLLHHEDPKVRKNCALLVGCYPGTVDILLDAYNNENTEYVKEAYIKGISLQDCKAVMTSLQKIQSQLLKQEDGVSKHIQAQLKILNPLILKYQGHKKKVIKLKHEPVDVVLTSLPYYQFVLFEHVMPLRYKPVSQGVLVRTESIYDLLKIRVYKDMLIPLQGASGLMIDYDDIVEGLKRCNILEILDKLYDDHEEFYFRVVDGMREKNPPLLNKVSHAVFSLYPQRLLNTTENYDIEIVIKEVRKGKVNLYLKLTHLKNPRFDYRREVIPTSIQPYIAATLLELAKPYMIEHARVLDPFAGVGTLLIERNIMRSTKFSMGIDIYGKGIEAAKKNTKIAGMDIHYVHKDALRFVNNEMFDEIITDMPTLAQVKDERQLKDLYDRFFARIYRWVKPDGYVFLYTSEISLVRKNLRLQEGYLSLVEHYEIPRGKNMFYFFIMKVK